MAELDTIILTNPTASDFTWQYNGEAYTVPANSTKPFAKFVGYHLAKHLSSKMIQEELDKKLAKDKTKNPNQKASIVSQAMIYDNPQRRITLYQILNDKEIVQEVIKAYPFKGFVGEMSEYEDYVRGQTESKATPEKTKVEPASEG